jgi:DNA-binding response OmpR family regulator
MRALIIEDELELSRVIASKLGRSGFIADHAASIKEARFAAQAHSYSFALLDRRLPDGDGISLLSDLRRIQPGIRILVLTACDAVSDRIAGLDAGADDYLTKPFDVDELMARIRACLRRSEIDTAPPITIGELSFDTRKREVSIRGQPIVLHRRELALLEALVCRSGRVILRAALMEEVYGADDGIEGNALNILISRLRRRLFEIQAGVEIHSARGIGYMLVRSTV